MNDEPALEFASAEDWRAWLAEHHASASGLWIRFARKGSGVESVDHDAALEVALAFGWIDARAGKGDETHWVQRFTPRSARSTWSKINCAKAEALIASGEMQLAGLREVERAKADGRWERAYDAPSTAKVPDDLRRELDADPAADAFFSGLDSRNRYSILHRLQTAKKPETRARRLERFVAMLKAGEKLYP